MTKSTLTLITLAALTFTAPLWAQDPYSSPGTEAAAKQESKPAKQAYRGPVLSTALPTTGPYANGLFIARPIHRPSIPPRFQPPLPSTTARPNLGLTPIRTNPILRVSSNDFAPASIYRALFDGLRGPGTTF